MIKKQNLAQARHIKFLNQIEKQAALGFVLLMDSLLKDIKSSFKKEKLAKADDLPRGWTGEVPVINIDLSEILDKAISKHIKALEWILLGGYADKEAIKIAKALGLTEYMIPGVAPASYLQSIDAHREHYKDVMGEEAVEIPKALVKLSLDEIKKRALRTTAEFGGKVRSKILDALEQAIRDFNFKNLNAAHAEAVDLLPVSGEEAISEAIEGLPETIRIGTVTKAINSAQEKLETDWERVLKTESAMSSAVGAHQAMLEIYGNDNDDLTVIIEGFYDDKMCDWCYDASKKADGTFKKYKMKDFQASGYNFNRRKSEWKLCIPPFHFNCRCQNIFLPRGFTVDKDGNFVPK